jgi:hypothetical protein
MKLEKFVYGVKPMLVMMTDQQIFTPQTVCSGCLLATQSGTPRWHNGRLTCGHTPGQVDNNQTKFYECEMGFKVANVN